MTISITIKQADNFSFTGIKNLNNDLGSIERDRDLTFNHDTFEKYKCKFNHQFTEEIVVEVDTGIYTVTNYKKVKNFDLFYSKKNNLLFFIAPNKVVNAFCKKLDKDLTITIHNYTFDFLNIVVLQNSTKVVNFKVEDIHIDNKTFNGVDVENNDEVREALVNDKATYMVLNMDVANEPRSIGFSKKGIIVIQNKIYATAGIPEPYLKCAHDILLAIRAID